MRRSALTSSTQDFIAATRVAGSFDDAGLDTPFLAMSIPWNGTLHQYAGRFHRLIDLSHPLVVI